MKYLPSLTKISNFCFATQNPGFGVTGFKSLRFYWVSALYLGAFLVLAHDPFFQKDGVFCYQQGVFTLLLAFTISAALNWEFNLFGKPAGANILLQALQILPLGILLARLSSTPSTVAPPGSFLGKLFAETGSMLGSVFGDWLSFLPGWVTDLFSNYRSSLLLVLVLFVLSLKNLRYKIGALLCLLVLLLGSNLEGGNLEFMLGGTLLLAVGMALQFCRYDQVLYYENILHRLPQSASVDQALFGTVLRLMRQAKENSGLAENTVLQIVQSEYAATAPDADFGLLAGEITRKMVFEYNLLTVKLSQSGLLLLPTPELSENQHLLTAVAAVPRVALILAVAALWILLPLDLIPDALPFFGVLDDMTVTILSSIVLKNAMQK